MRILNLGFGNLQTLDGGTSIRKIENIGSAILPRQNCQVHPAVLPSSGQAHAT